MADLPPAADDPDGPLREAIELATALAQIATDRERELEELRSRLLEVETERDQLAEENLDLTEGSEELRQALAIDTLMRVLSRRGMFAWIEAKLEDLPESEPTPVSVRFKDIRKFKYVNDTHGHSYGDVLMNMLGRAERNALLEYYGQNIDDLGVDDIPFENLPVAIARYGGDERVEVSFDPSFEFERYDQLTRTHFNRIYEDEIHRLNTSPGITNFPVGSVSVVLDATVATPLTRDEFWDYLVGYASNIVKNKDGVELTWQTPTNVEITYIGETENIPLRGDLSALDHLESEGPIVGTRARVRSSPHKAETPHRPTSPGLTHEAESSLAFMML